MSYPTYPGGPASQQRPSTVTFSSYLLWVTAGISIIGGILAISVVGRTIDAYADLYEGTAAEGTEPFLAAVSIGGVVINLLFAAGLAILSIFNNRGRQGARITTWVLGGLLICCGGFGLLGNAATSSMNLDSTGSGGPSASEVEARLNEALPGWYTPTSTALSVISLLAMLGAVILLALPASNAFFRKPAGPAWDPSQPYPYPNAGGDPGYPGTPGYPPAPGYPTGQPPYPGQPTPPPSGPPASGPPASGPPSQDPPSNDPWGRPPTDPSR